jgi:hypothetical protein
MNYLVSNNDTILDICDNINEVSKHIYECPDVRVQQLESIQDLFNLIISKKFSKVKENNRIYLLCYKENNIDWFKCYNEDLKENIIVPWDFDIVLKLKGLDKLINHLTSPFNKNFDVVDLFSALEQDLKQTVKSVSSDLENYTKEGIDFLNKIFK